MVDSSVKITFYKSAFFYFTTYNRNDNGMRDEYMCSKYPGAARASTEYGGLWGPCPIVLMWFTCHTQFNNMLVISHFNPNTFSLNLEELDTRSWKEVGDMFWQIWYCTGDLWLQEWGWEFYWVVGWGSHLLDVNAFHFIKPRSKAVGNIQRGTPESSPVSHVAVTPLEQSNYNYLCTQWRRRRRRRFRQKIESTKENSKIKYSNIDKDGTTQ